MNVAAPALNKLVLSSIRANEDDEDAYLTEMKKAQRRECGNENSSSFVSLTMVWLALIVRLLPMGSAECE